MAVKNLLLGFMEKSFNSIKKVIVDAGIPDSVRRAHNFVWHHQPMIAFYSAAGSIALYGIRERVKNWLTEAHYQVSGKIYINNLKAQRKYLLEAPKDSLEDDFISRINKAMAVEKERDRQMLERQREMDPEMMERQREMDRDMYCRERERDRKLEKETIKNQDPFVLANKLYSSMVSSVQIKKREKKNEN